MVYLGQSDPAYAFSDLALITCANCVAGVLMRRTKFVAGVLMRPRSLAR